MLELIVQDPGKEEVSEEEELKRLLPALKRFKMSFQRLSFLLTPLDPKLRARALDLGAALINDISAGESRFQNAKNSWKISSPLYCNAHARYSNSMQQNPTYENIIDELIYFFSEKIKEAHSAGINDVIIDPGFGFGKTIPT